MPNCIYKVQDWKNAIADYDQAVKIDPNDAVLWNDRGLAKKETFDKSGAIDDYIQAIKLKSAKRDDDADKSDSLASTFENRADLYVKLGEYQKAVADYSQTIGQKLGGTLLLYLNLERFSCDVSGIQLSRRRSHHR